MLVIPVNRVVDKKKSNHKKLRAKEEERHKGSLTQKIQYIVLRQGHRCGSNSTPLSD
jgi:hypothetical protein